MALTNSNFDGNKSATLNMWMSRNYQNLFIRNNAFFVKLREKGNVKIGGLKMLEPIMFPHPNGPSAVGVTSGYTAVTQTAQSGYSSAEYIPAEYIIPISFEEYDLDMQTSETERVDWEEAQLMRGIELMMVKIESDLWAGGETAAGAANSRGALGSLQVFLNGGTAATATQAVEPAELAQQLGNRGVCGATSATLITSVGGLERAATGGGYWSTPIINTSQAIGVQPLSNLLSLTANGGRKADLIITHRDMFDKLQNLASIGGSNGGQFFSESKLANLGFDAIRFRNADIITDDRVPTIVYLNGTTTSYAYNAFALNTSFFKLRAKTMKPKLRPVDDARPLKVYTGRWLGQITSGHLGRVHARHVNLN